MTLFLFLIILVALVLVHEAGHFLLAKMAGIRVDEFGVGFPPRVCAVKKGETEYSLNLLPLGGFVKIFGENPEEDPEENLEENGGENEGIEQEKKKSTKDTREEARSFANKPKKIQALVLAAGIVFNIIFAWPLLSLAYLSGLPASASSPVPAGGVVQNPELTITEVLAGSPAEEAGFRAGDKILSLSLVQKGKENAKIFSHPSAEEFQEFVKRQEGKTLTAEIARGEEMRDIAFVPKAGIIPESPETPAIGIAMDTIGILKLPLGSAILEGGKMTLFLTKETAVGLVHFFTDIFRGQADFSQVSGPVGIASIVGDAEKMGLASVLSIAALISLNLGLINLLPIPALDGGRLFFLLIEAVKGSPVRPKIANAAHALGFILLLVLIIVITYRDILKLV